MPPTAPFDWLDAFGDDAPVIDPGRHMCEMAERAGEAQSTASAPLVLASFMPPTVEVIADTIGGQPTWRSGVRVGELDGMPAAVAKLSAGASWTVMTLEELIAGGARTILIGGAIGSLQPHIHIGHNVVPTDARREEGTSFHYAGPEHAAAASGPATHALLEAAHEGPRPAHEGRVWTTDAPYREFRGKVVRYAAEGDLGVEMETSAVLTLAAVRGVDIGMVLTVSDHVFDPGWGNIFGTDEYRANCADLARVMLAAARKLVAAKA
ncbi:MAG: nucleoside phosphorylase [Chloroflexi bacterium]|nr:nucleoside phosphorylase [Chloroflexota bacterium]